MILGLMDTIVRKTDSPGARNAVASGPRGNRLVTDSQEAAPTAKNLFKTILIVIGLAAIFYATAVTAGQLEDVLLISQWWDAWAMVRWPGAPSQAGH